MNQNTTDANADADADELLRIARTRRDKVLRFVGEFDGTANDGEPVTCYMAYRGNFGWSACMSNGEWLGQQTEEHVEASFAVYNHVELVDVGDTPDAVDL